MRRPLARSLVVSRRPGLFYGAAVRDYLDRVRAADGSGLDRAVTDGINVYLSGLVSANMLGTSGGVISQAASKIKAHCIMSGVNTLTGAFVPVVGTAPTNFNFVAGDYLRKTGVKGDGVNKYLNTNRQNDADPQNSKHLSAYVTETPSADSFIVSSGGAAVAGNSSLIRDSGAYKGRINVATGATPLSSSVLTVPAFIGIARSASNAQNIRVADQTATDATASVTPNASVIQIFGRPEAATSRADARLSLYSIGEFIDLAILRTLQDRLMATFAAAIP